MQHPRPAIFKALLLGLALLAGTISPAARAADYVVGSTLESMPNVIATGDFNGDGKLDIVCANIGENSLSILLNKGDGTFNTHQDIQLTGTVGYYSQLIVADFNGDGKLDIAVNQPIGTESTATTNIIILAGDGAGNFTLSKTLTCSGVGIQLLAGKFTGKSVPDLIIPSIINNHYATTIFVNDGHGNFAAAKTIAEAADYSGLQIGDFNNDGKLDLIYGYDGWGSSGSGRLLFGDGAGGFAAGINAAYTTIIGDFVTVQSP